MNAFQNKTKSKKGASMVLALLFLLFCLTIGAVVLTAATANIGRVNRLRQQEQEYLAVKSAAQLLNSELSQIKLVAIYTEKEKTNYFEDGSSEVTPGGKFFQSATITGETYAKDLLESDFALLFQREKGFSPSYTEVARTMELNLNQPSFPLVTAKITVKKDYSLQVVLQEKVEEGNQMTLRLRPIVEENEVTEYVDSNQGATVTATTTHTTTVKFSSGEITKGGVS